MFAFFCTIALFAGLEPVSQAQVQSTAGRITFTNSVKEPVAATTNAASVAKNTPTVVRSQLTDAEMEATIDFSIALKMRNFAELQQRVASGEGIPLDEMRAKYFPLDADLDKTRQWLVAQGFEVSSAGEYDLSVFARGTVAQLQRVFGVTFARVQFRGEEHTSAVTAPSLPADVAGPVLSVNGLQPHLHPFPHSVRKAISPGKSIQNQPPYLVSEIAGAYDGQAANGGRTRDWDRDRHVSSQQRSNGILGRQFRAGIAQQHRKSAGSCRDVTGPVRGGNVRCLLEQRHRFGSEDPHLCSRGFQSAVQQAGPSLSAHHQRSTQPAGTASSLDELRLGRGLYRFGTNGNRRSLLCDTRCQWCHAICLIRGWWFQSGHGNGNYGGPVQVESPANDPNVTAVGGTSLNLNSNGTVSSETV